MKSRYLVAITKCNGSAEFYQQCEKFLSLFFKGVLPFISLFSSWHNLTAAFLVSATLFFRLLAFNLLRLALALALFSLTGFCGFLWCLLWI
jgi:hypothetical protein